MNSSTLCLPSFSVGQDCYQEIAAMTRRYGRTAAVIGGHTALEKARESLIEGIEGSDIELLGFWEYGGDSTYENGDALIADPSIANADMIFGVGGGRALDTCKYVADKLDKPLFNFPTLGSNCAAVTAISVIYNPDGTFREYYYPKLAVHTFINTDIVADSPENLLWAGIGDALSKEAEAVFTSKDQKLAHTPSMGVQLSKICTDPLLEYGKQALEECRSKQAGEALEQVVLDIIISTGLVSNMVSKVPEYYYNSSLAHMVYYAATVTEHGHAHLHGEVVSLGVLCLLAYQQDWEEYDRIARFNASIGLPVTFEDIEISPDEFEKMADKAATTVEWGMRPEGFEKEDFIAMLELADEKGRAFKEQLQNEHPGEFTFEPAYTGCSAALL